MENTYWSRVLTRRLGRRRALLGAAGAAGAAAFLSACGDDSDDSVSPTAAATGAGTTSAGATGTAGLVVQPVDTFAQAKRGGSFKDYAQAEPRSLDPINPLSDLNRIAPKIYSTLIAQKPSKLAKATYELQGDVAESFEISPDGLQITAKLRPGVKFHDRPPVNGRELDTDDVLFSFERFAEMAPLRTLVWNSQSPDAPMLEPSAPDASTIVMPLKEPVAYMINWFASFGSFTGLQIIYPKEADSALDLRQDMIGTGPFHLTEHVPSVSFTLGRNPNYWDQDYALVDQIEMPVLPEYATRQSQLRAGEVLFAINVQTMRMEDVLPAKNDQPALLLYESPTQVSNRVITFGVLGENPYKDERVRQAISMSFDRDLDIDVRFNVKEFEEAGIPVQTVWNSHLAAEDPFVAGGWFLDPQSSEFGPNAKYFQYNPEEAKKLLAAAGYPDGFEVAFSYPHAPQFTTQAVVEPFFFYLQEIGLKVVDGALTDYTQGYIPNLRDAEGQFEGIGYHSVTGSTPITVSPTSALVSQHLPSSGVTFHGYSLDGGTGKTGDPALVEILDKARVEQDVEARKELVREAQRYLGKAMWSLNEPGAASGYWMAWPAVQNFRTWSGESPWEMYQIWLDQTKAPFA